MAEPTNMNGGNAEAVAAIKAELERQAAEKEKAIAVLVGAGVDQDAARASVGGGAVKPDSGGSLDETKFRAWYRGWAKKAKIDPDPDNPEHRYDYRAAFRAGVEPSLSPDDGRYHWDSRFKALDHPNRYVQTPEGVVDTITGKIAGPGINTMQLAPKDAAAAREFADPRLAPAADAATAPIAAADPAAALTALVKGGAPGAAPASPGAPALAGSPGAPMVDALSQTLLAGGQGVGGGQYVPPTPLPGAAPAPTPQTEDQFAFAPQSKPAAKAGAGPGVSLNAGVLSIPPPMATIKTPEILGEAEKNAAVGTAGVVAASKAAADESAALLQHGRIQESEIEQKAAADKATLQADIVDAKKQFDDATQSVDASQIKDFWANKSTGTKIFAALAMGMGAFGAALTKTPNFAMQIIEKAIDDDMAYQKTLLAKAERGAEAKRTTLDALRGQLKDAGLAELAARRAAWQDVGTQLQVLQAKTTSAVAAGQAQIMQGQVQAHLGQLDQQGQVEIGKLVEERHKTDTMGVVGLAEAEIKAAAQKVKEIPTTVKEQLSQLRALDNQISLAEKSFATMTSKASYVTQHIWNTDSNRYNQMGDYLAASLLKAMQGSRPSDFDFKIYRNLIARADDSKETAAWKTSMLRAVTLGYQKALETEFGATPNEVISTDQKLKILNNTLRANWRVEAGAFVPLRGPDVDNGSLVKNLDFQEESRSPVATQ